MLAGESGGSVVIGGCKGLHWKKREKTTNYPVRTTPSHSVRNL